MTPAEAVAASSGVILDFDGPMCSAFSSVSAAEAADQLRNFVRAQSIDGLTLPVDDDPLGALETAAGFDSELGWSVAHLLTHIELDAVVSATPADGLQGLLEGLTKSESAIAVASNNSKAAIEWWVDRWGIAEYFTGIVGRSHNGRRLKPDPFIVQQACVALDLNPQDLVFVGDSVSDLEAARTVSLPFLAFANRPGKRQMFLDAGCGSHEIVANLEELT